MCSNWIILPGARLKSKAIACSAGGAATADENKKINKVLLRSQRRNVVRFMMSDIEIGLKHSSTPVSKSDKSSDILHEREDKVHAFGGEIARMGSCQLSAGIFIS